jgi:hypothetical protein
MLFHDMMNDQSFFWNQQYTRSELLLHYSFVMCCSMIRWMINLLLEISNILDENFCCTIHVSCVVPWNDERLIFFFKSAIYSVRSLLRTIYLSCVVRWYDERSIFLFKSAIYSIKSLVGTVHLSCVVPWYDERGIFLLKSAIYSIRTFVELLICHMLFHNMMNDQSFFSNQ